MPGRQSHGRPLLGQPKPASRKPQRGKAAGSRAAVLNAFASAEKAVPHSSGIRAPRVRDLDSASNPKKRHRADDEDGDDDDDEHGDDAAGRSRTKSKRTRRDQDRGTGGGGGSASESEYGSDDEGNEFRIGKVGSEDDSELDSDEAFGESDEERFEGFVFRGSSSNKKPSKAAKIKNLDAAGEEIDEESEDGDSGDDDDLSSLGEEAIDLAQALDQVSDDDDEVSAGDTESGSEDEDDGDSSSSESATSDAEEDEDEDDPSKLAALQTLVSSFAGQEGEDDGEGARSSAKPKIGLNDLGLVGVKDPSIRRSLKLMQKEENAAGTGKSSGISRKLDVPLAKRQQDRLLRVAASEKANKTLDRWQDTVKHNRRAEHLVFPLPNTLHDAGLDKGELAPLFGPSQGASGSGNRANAGTELEQTILSIMEESGLGPSAKSAPPPEFDAEGNQLSQAEMQDLWAQRRRDREKQSREQARAARIKKIKSKAYRRVHRRERKANELKEQEAGAGGAAMDSEEEREAQHRARALERVGARHRESKWAKSAKRGGVAAWDEEKRAGLVEMARRNNELRRRVEGRPATGTDDDEDSDDEEGGLGPEDDNRAERKRLLRELELAAADGDDVPESNIMKMKFMQRGEADRRKANAEMIAQLRRELASDDERSSDGEDEDEGPAEIGRRSYGLPGAKAITKKVNDDDDAGDDPTGATDMRTATHARPSSMKPPKPQSLLKGLALTEGDAWDKSGSWSRPAASSAEASSVSKKKGRRVANPEQLLVDMSNGSPAAKTREVKERRVSSGSQLRSGLTRDEAGDESDSDADAALHLPLAIRDRELAERAFAGEDLAGSFEQEKAEIAEEDDDKVVDNTLPGWGSWVGEGVSNHQKKLHQGRYLTKVEGVKKKNRKDAKLERVIISEKRVKKNDKYLASQLPHVFETKDQYERSLRLPVGPEWTTKQTFQDATKPRILMKQGIIAPMAKPLS